MVSSGGGRIGSGQKRRGRVIGGRAASRESRRSRSSGATPHKRTTARTNCCTRQNDSGRKLTDRREQVVAGALAAATDFGAEAAVLVVRSVPVALLGAAEARDATGLDHCPDKAQVSCGLAGHDTAGRVADVGAVEAEANATHHLPYVVLGEIGVGTTRTAGGTVEALVYAAQHRGAIEAGRLRMRLKDLLKSHVSPFLGSSGLTRCGRDQRIATHPKGR